MSARRGYITCPASKRFPARVREKRKKRLACIQVNQRNGLTPMRSNAGKSKSHLSRVRKKSASRLQSVLVKLHANFAAEVGDLGREDGDGKKGRGLIELKKKDGANSRTGKTSKKSC